MDCDGQPSVQIFGECLVRLRKARGLSQKFIAIKTGLDPSYLAGIELGKRPPPQQRVLDRILRALDASPSEINKIRGSIGITRLARIAERTFEPSYGQSLIRIAVGMQSCSQEELKALEVIVQGFDHRRTTTEEEIKM